MRPEGESFKAMAKVRYHQPDQEAQVTLLPDGMVRLDFAQPQRAVAPGQIATVYVGDMVLGGGTILKAVK
jgi:tRNA-specific 2-thiouridylase